MTTKRETLHSSIRRLTSQTNAMSQLLHMSPNPRQILCSEVSKATMYAIWCYHNLWLQLSSMQYHRRQCMSWSTFLKVHQKECFQWCYHYVAVQYHCLCCMFFLQGHMLMYSTHLDRVSWFASFNAICAPQHREKKIGRFCATYTGQNQGIAHVYCFHVDADNAFCRIVH